MAVTIYGPDGTTLAASRPVPPPALDDAGRERLRLAQRHSDREELMQRRTVAVLLACVLVTAAAVTVAIMWRAIPGNALPAAPNPTAVGGIAAPDPDEAVSAASSLAALATNPDSLVAAGARQHVGPRAATSPRVDRRPRLPPLTAADIAPINPVLAWHPSEATGMLAAAAGLRIRLDTTTTHLATVDATRAAPHTPAHHLGHTRTLDEAQQLIEHLTGIGELGTNTPKPPPTPRPPPPRSPSLTWTGSTALPPRPPTGARTGSAPGAWPSSCTPPPCPPTTSSPTY